MAGNVGERFLDYPVRSGLDRGREAPVKPVVAHLNGDACPALIALEIGKKCGDEAERIERRRPEVHRNLTDTGRQLADGFQCFIKRLFAVRSGLAIQRSELNLKR